MVIHKVEKKKFLNKWKKGELIMDKKLKILMIGAHMDDNDFRSAGTALKYVKAGHSVRFLSVCNGAMGHHEMAPEDVYKRRLEECREASLISGIEYDNMGLPECEITASVENRKKIICYIREYQPDIIFTHRTNDYHVDHREVALLVQDASYLLIVPHFCPEAKALKKVPLIMYFHDNFTNPKFNPDVVIPTDDVIDTKYKMINCYVSQVYEWLPWTTGVLAQVPKDPEKRLEWLRNPRVPRDGTLLKEEDLKIPIASNNSEYREARPAIMYRDKIVERYGEKARNTLFAEAFQVSEYGEKLTKENIDIYFPF